MTRWGLFGAFALLATGCQILSYTWTAPPQVAAGSVFVMDVTGVTDWSPFDTAWAIFQLPNGFEVLGAGFVAQPGGYMYFADVTTNPAALAPYVADPGHHLVGVSGQAQIVKSAITADVKIYVRAPAAASTHTLRMALAVGSPGALQPQLGLSSFQTATGSTARSVQVQAVPASKPFTIANDGLWGLAKPLGLACRDVDRDGRADLVLVHSNDIKVFRAGLGGFALVSTIPLPFAVSTRLPIAATDLDGDGWTDLVTANGRIWFGVDGTNWTVGPVLAQSFYYTDVGTGDFDGDGNVDVAIWASPSFRIFRGLGNRTFAAAATLPPPSGSGTWLLAEDLDLDGRSELVLPTAVGGVTELWRWVPGVGWTLGATMPSARAACAIEADGLPGKELLLSGQAARYRWTGQSMVVVQGTQALAFERAAVADFDRDGFDDVLLAENPSPAPATLTAWRRTSATQFAAVNLPAIAGFRVLGRIPELAAGDFDGDTWPDAFAAIDVPLAWHNTNTGAAPYGVGCSIPSQQAPQLQAVGTVGTAQSFDLRLASGLPAAATVFWAGSSLQSLHGLQVMPLSLAPFGAPGCFLHAEPIDVAFAIADGAGVATLPVTVPALPSTWQVTVYSQAAAIDLAANPFGGRFSPGLALKIQ